jgi:hypothetical protein
MAEALIDDIDGISSDSDNELTRILENKDSKNTKRSTKNAILAFHSSLIKDVKSADHEKYLLYWVLLNTVRERP